MIRLSRLRRDRKGVSALEFALCLPVLLILIGGLPTTACCGTPAAICPRR